MKKIIRILIAIAITSLPSHLAASAEAVASDAATSESMIVQDIEALRPYYEAIKQIRATLEAAAQSFDCRTGFTGWPSPNPFYYRTPKYLFLETMVISGEEQLYRLYSPFGEVKLLDSGLLSRLITISTSFLASMDWNIEDVTDRVHGYNYRQDTNAKYGPFPFHNEPWEGAHAQSKLYLIKCVHSINLCPKSSADEELILLDTFCLAKGQYERDKEQFNLLSAGKKCF